MTKSLVSRPVARELRVDPALWQELERLAASELRSVNAQVEYLLREAMTRRGVVFGGERKKNRNPR